MDATTLDRAMRAAAADLSVAYLSALPGVDALLHDSPPVCRSPQIAASPPRSAISPSHHTT